MNMLMIALRVIHIVLGVFWVGTIFFVVSYLQPSVQALGPQGGPLMQQLLQRRFFTALPVIAVLTIVAGLALYWRDSAGFTGEWMGTRAGMAFGTGGVLSLVAFVIGLFVMRSSTLKALALGPKVQQMAEGSEREAAMQQVQALRQRAATSARWVATLLALTVIAMAVARYL
jgi:uncharacterized membrane protein